MVDGCRVGCPAPCPSGVGCEDGMVDGGAVRRIVRVPVETGVGPKDGAKLGFALGSCDGSGVGGAPPTNVDAPSNTQESNDRSFASTITSLILFHPSFAVVLQFPEAVRTEVKPSASTL